MAVNLQGLFCKMAFRQQALLSTFSPPPTSRVCWWLRPCWRKKKRKKTKKEKCKLTPVYWRFSSLCLPRDALPWLQTLFYILISTVTIGRRANAYKSDKQGPGCRGTCFWAEKYSKNNSSSCVVWVRRSLEGTKCWKSTHTVLGWVFVHVMNVI